MKQHFFILFFVLPFLSLAQTNRVVCEVFYTDDGSVEGYPENYTTYRIYAELSDTVTCLTSVFAFGCDGLHISTDNDTWQHPMGNILGPDLNPALFPSIPALEYDSFLTIGKANRYDGRGTVIKAIGTGEKGFIDFEDGKDLRIIDGAWACLRTESNGYGNKILLAQITTSKTLTYALNLQLVHPDRSVSFLNAKVYDENCEVETVDEGLKFGLLKLK